MTMQNPVIATSVRRGGTMLFREVLGSQLRVRRAEQGLTLRQLSARSNVALGYLSEIERGRKEPSSELFAAICRALEIPASRIVLQCAEALAVEENKVLPIQRSQTTKSSKAA